MAEKKADRGMTSQLRARQSRLPEPDMQFVPRRAQAESPSKQLPSLPLTQKRSRKPKLRTSQKNFAHLDENWQEEMRAGASDDDLAKWSGVPKNAVTRWRRARGVHRRPTTKKERKVAFALDLFGTGHGDVLHRTEDSPIGGVFNVPEFVIRRPLDYGELVRHLWFLQHKLGSSTELLAKTFGLREEDVKAGLNLWDAFLEKNGRECDHCGLRCIKHDRYCSVECWDGARKKYEENQ